MRSNGGDARAQEAADEARKEIMGRVMADEAKTGVFADKAIKSDRIADVSTWSEEHRRLLEQDLDMAVGRCAAEKTVVGDRKPVADPQQETSDARAPMWSYYVDKHGAPSAALRRQFQEHVEADPRLAAALLQIDAMEALIDKIMRERGA